jgi:hypothetical protein
MREVGSNQGRKNEKEKVKDGIEETARGNMNNSASDFS